VPPSDGLVDHIVDRLDTHPAQLHRSMVAVVPASSL
jgi:hypothetical protein